MKGVKDLCRDRERVNHESMCHWRRMGKCGVNGDDHNNNGDKLVENHPHHASLINKLYNIYLIE